MKRTLIAIVGLGLAISWAGRVSAHPVNPLPPAIQTQELQRFQAGLVGKLVEPDFDQRHAQAEAAEQNAYFETHPIKRLRNLRTGKTTYIYATPEHHIEITTYHYKTDYLRAQQAKFAAQLRSASASRNSGVKRQVVGGGGYVPPVYDQDCSWTAAGNQSDYCTEGGDLGSDLAAFVPDFAVNQGYYGINPGDYGDGCSAKAGYTAEWGPTGRFLCGFVPSMTTNQESTLASDINWTWNGTGYTNGDICGSGDGFCIPPFDVPPTAWCGDYFGLGFSETDGTCFGIADDDNNAWDAPSFFAYVNSPYYTYAACGPGSIFQPIGDYPSNQYIFIPGTPASQTFDLSCWTPTSSSYIPIVAGSLPFGQGQKFGKPGKDIYETDYAEYTEWMPGPPWIVPTVSRLTGSLNLGTDQDYSDTYLQGQYANNYPQTTSIQQFSLAPTNSNTPCLLVPWGTCYQGWGVSIGAPSSTYN
jgi:hypothetical protein